MERRKSFYEIQKEQKRKSVFVFFLLIGVYFVSIGVIYLLLSIPIKIFLFVEEFRIFTGWHFAIILGISVLIALYQWYDVKRNGARFILERVNAEKPDRRDLYHRKLVDVVEEVRIGAGYKHPINVYVIPANVVNSFALTEADGTAAIGVSEGALARLTRDELQAVVAHEMAHIMRGDAFYVTLVCSLANFFQRISDAFQSERENTGFIMRNRYAAQAEGARIAGEGLTALMAFIIRFLGLLISREREYLADATAVEFTRNPDGLARAILKAHRYYSYLGDPGETYSPIFIVSPESRGLVAREGFFKRILSTHPPSKDRIEKLTAMSNLSFMDLEKDVRAQEKKREEARAEIKSVDETTDGVAGIPGGILSATAIAQIAKTTMQGKSIPEPQEKKLWGVRDAHGKWLGPFDLAGLFAIPWFTGMTRVRPSGTDIEVPARSFPEIIEGFRNPASRNFKKGGCPVCSTQLIEANYEGVPIYLCPRCGGRLVSQNGVVRIIARRGVKASKYLIEKAHRWAKEHTLNPFVVKKSDGASATKQPPRYHCPLCGGAMIRKPFSYQYFIEIDFCGGCKVLWFDGDELEILQTLIEDSGY